MNVVFEQLELDFTDKFGVGSLQEAIQIFEACGDRWEPARPPAGWEIVGDGSTRDCYLSPSGVLYKICKEYLDNEPSANAHEYQNFREINERGLLPEGWFTPKVSLYTFSAYYMHWNRKAKEPSKHWGMVDVLACEYIPGEDGTLSDDEVDVVFARVGLFDPTMWNAKVHEYTGELFIIDAGEWVQEWPTPVAA